MDGREAAPAPEAVVDRRSTGAAARVPATFADANAVSSGPRPTATEPAADTERLGTKDVAGPGRATSSEDDAGTWAAAGTRSDDTAAVGGRQADAGIGRGRSIEGVTGRSVRNAANGGGGGEARFGVATGLDFTGDAATTRLLGSGGGAERTRAGLSCLPCA